MLSSILKNDSIYYNNSQYQRRSQIEFNKNKYLPKISKNQKKKSNTLINNKFLSIKSQKNAINAKYNGKTNSFEEKAFKNILMKNKKNINNKNNSTFNKSTFSLIKKEGKYNIKQLNKSVLPSIYKDKKESNNNSLIKENDNLNSIHCNYLYLQYKGENKNKGFNKITYIEINPHKIISSLNEITRDNNLQKQLFNSIRNHIYINSRNNIIDKTKNLKNNISSKSESNNNYTNYYYEILDKINNFERNKNEKNDNYDYNKDDINKSNITFVYDKFLLPNKDNKYNFSIHNLFLFDIINKVFKRMIELHDNNNKLITEEQMFKECKKQINKLKNFFDNKTKIKNINNKNEYLEIKSKNNNESIYKNIFIKNTLFNENNENINKSSEKEYEYEYDNIINRETFFNLKDKIIKKHKYSLKNIFEINNKISIYKTARKLMPYFKNEKKDKLYKNSSIPNFMINKNKLNNSIYRFEIGPKLNIIDFNEISHEIDKQAKMIKNNNNN